MERSRLRSLSFFGLCLGLLTLSGCAGAFDPFQRPGNWSETNANIENIAQQSANKADLIQGSGDPGTSGAVAIAGIDKVTGSTSSGGGTSSLSTALTPTAPGGSGGN
jgi:hypothetical protein